MFDCIVIGGGIAGLQAAIQLGRYHHKVLVLDANRGRSTLCRSYHNLLGWPGGVSGVELRRLGREQALAVGVRFHNAVVQAATPLKKNGFSVTAKPVVPEPAQGQSASAESTVYEAKTLFIATGITEHLLPIPGLQAALGISVYVCPDCDGYECSDKETVVIGAGDTGAEMAVTLLHWTPHLTYINHASIPIEQKLQAQMQAKGIRYLAAEVEHIESDANAMISRVVLADGRSVSAERGFTAFGGNRVESALAAGLGALCNEKKHILVHPRTKMTSVQNVWAGGDVAAHSEQVSIAMGDGSQAAIFIHKALKGENVTPYPSQPAPSTSANHK